MSPREELDGPGRSQDDSDGSDDLGEGQTDLHEESGDSVGDEEANDDGSDDSSDGSDDDDSSDEEEEVPTFSGVNKEDLKVPKDIALDLLEVPSVVEFHPKENLLAIGLIEGDIRLYRYAEEETPSEEKKMVYKHGSVRDCKFFAEGKELLSVCSNMKMVHCDVETGQAIHTFENAHETSINRICVIDEYLAVTGDDNGVLKIWDYRSAKKCTQEFKGQCDDTINDMCVDQERKKTLLVASGEGTLTVLDVRGKKLVHQSELFDHETTSVAIIKQGKKAVVGSGDGAVNIFNWGEWGHMSDRLPGLKHSIEHITPFTESIVLLGCEDGYIRAANILPNRHIGIVGRHGRFPLEGLRLCRESKFAATCSHDSNVKFHRVDFLQEWRSDNHSRRNQAAASKPLVRTQDDNFFAGLADD